MSPPNSYFRFPIFVLETPKLEWQCSQYLELNQTCVKYLIDRSQWVCSMIVLNEYTVEVDIYADLQMLAIQNKVAMKLDQLKWMMGKLREFKSVQEISLLLPPESYSTKSLETSFQMQGLQIPKGQFAHVPFINTVLLKLCCIMESDQCSFPILKFC